MQNEHQALAKIRRIASRWLADHEEDATTAMQKVAAVLLEPAQQVIEIKASDFDARSRELLKQIEKIESPALREVERLDAENQRLRQRLEIDPRHPYDGIDCRNATIQLLESELARWKDADQKASAHIQFLQAEAQGLRETIERLAIVQEDAQATAAARDVLVERRRQVVAEGWTPEHDDQHEGGTLAEAAGCYALHAHDAAEIEGPPAWWPWDAGWWKPSPDPRRNLVKAGALILAEIERLDRAAAVKPVELYSADDEARMDVIGTNGNDGLHYQPPSIADEEQVAFDNEYHKIPALIGRSEWSRLWALGLTPPQLRADGWTPWYADGCAPRPENASHVMLRRGVEMENRGQINWGSLSDSFRMNEVIAYRLVPDTERRDATQG